MKKAASWPQDLKAGHMEKKQYLTAREAASELGISVDTLYAYVSRGLLHSEAAGNQKRSRRYPIEEIERLQKRKGEFRHPDKVAAGTMHAGTPLMESAITLITADHFYYRGQDALNLATTCSVEQVAALIWTGDSASAKTLFRSIPPESRTGRYQKIAPHLQGLGPLEAFQVGLPLAALEDIAAYDLRPEAVAQTGARVLQLLADIIASGQARYEGIAETIQQGWVAGDPSAAKLITAALILCADQEFNVTTFTARCVASAGSSPYAVIGAGLAALQGIKHAGQTERIEAFLRETSDPGNVRSSITSLLKRGETIPGFGEIVPGFGSVFYPAGDPRGKLLLDLTARAYPEAPVVALAHRITEETHKLLGAYPTVFFGLVTLARALKLPSNGAIALFALGRTIGWIGHSIEQYQSNDVLRPRAIYSGPPVQV
ncbi:MAG TPA: citrate synthase family protein [Chloroflexia bacterium]|nr:citrate synthase family protein [Chloroflexia bacterium]